MTTTATEYLRGLAQPIVDAARARVRLRAALLAGSAGRGDADFYSDIDLLLYVDAVPAVETLADLRTTVGGTNPIAKGEPTEHSSGEEFELHGVRTEVVFVTVARTEWLLDLLLDRLEEIDSPHQKGLSGILEGQALHGAELIERWRSRLREYPEPLRRAMVGRYWDFFPLWHYEEAMAVRDTDLWRLDVLVDSAFKLLGVLAGLNRLYFTRFELKRMRALVAQMELAPPDLADRLESLFRLERGAAAAELGRLVEETRDLVVAEFPDLELPLRLPPGTKQVPWRMGTP
jgi:hypothetical protein